ncbi:MAG TPA: NAD-dependent epimerase/dehydratase family protein [Bryobacteraceae bacterium]|jgi:UDP-glucose 4-epimerase
MNILVTGAAGFIGSNLVDYLLALDHNVTGIDNLSSGNLAFLDQAWPHFRFRLVQADLLSDRKWQRYFKSVDLVIHLAANADVRFGPQYPSRDLEQNTVATQRVLEAARTHGVKRIAFASTGSVYGEAQVIPTPENAPFPVQTSLYGASKLAAEGLVTAYAEAFGMQAHIFRFVSILGERYTHGHVFDFYKQLRDHPGQLQVLGDGTARKSYLYVKDCIRAIMTAVEKSTDRINIFNLGTDEYCQVNDSIGWITDALGVTPKREYSGGDRGWVGDNPFIFLETKKIRSLGWKPQLSIRQGVLKTVEYLRANPQVLDARGEAR